MSKNKILSIIFLIGLSANAQTINLKGVVSNTGGKPISGAIVSLVRQRLKDTTGTDGKYSFASTAIQKLPAVVPKANDISLNNDILQFTLSSQSPMKVETFDLKGNLLRQEINMNAAAGKYQFDISKTCHSSEVLVIRAAIGSSEVSFKYLPLKGGRHAFSSLNVTNAVSGSSGLIATAAVVDTITVSATKYQTKSVAITSLNQELNISLDSTDGKNAPVPSIGCGKELGSLKSGTYFVTSAGLNREYIIDIPKDYDKNKPYRLVFGMHCMCGSADRVAEAEKGDDLSAFYSMKTLAAKDNIPAIFVAPSAYATDYKTVAQNCIVWSQGEKDHTFFQDLLKLLKEQLCVDTTRVFSCGFSFGAMYTYSLSTNFPKQLRAVACYAPANWNIWLPQTIKHLPIAYFQTTGIDDGLCKWVNNDGAREGGKYCLLQHAEDNGCNTSVTIKLASKGGKHVITEFTGCNEGYPVRFGSFDGGHQGEAKDPGSTENWIEVETWNFFKQF